MSIRCHIPVCGVHRGQNEGLHNIQKIGETIKGTKVPRLFSLTQSLLPLISRCLLICLTSKLNAEHEQ